MADGHYLVLARKWRPRRFEEVIGQEHITRTLQNAITQGRIGHAFLFIGSRGIGKTTSARILAKALNCLSADSPTPDPCCECGNCTSIGSGTNIDVVEIDGASNNSVEDVRQIREHIQLVPSNSRYKIYIIDEVHQLSAGAFNALLKTLEEPPPHAIFVLATTEAHKVPATIVSRCQRYDFRRVGLEHIVALLTRIVEAESIRYEPEALYAIARAADGGIRDAESILEQVISYSGDEVTYQSVYDVLGLVEWDILHQLCDAMLDKDVATQLKIVEDVAVSGKDLPQFIQEILSYYRNLLVCKTADPTTLLALPGNEIEAMQERAARFSLTELIRLVEQFAELFKRDFDQQLAPRIALEALLIRCSRAAVEVSLDTVIEKLAQLGVGGITAPGGAPENPSRPLPPKAAEATPEPKTKAEKPNRNKRQTAAASINPEAVWSQVLAELGLSITAWLRGAEAVRIDNETLALRVPAGEKRTRSVLDDPARRAEIEEALEQAAPALRTYIVECDDTPITRPDPAVEPAVSQDDLPEQLARAAISDPGIANVVEVFKGRIVEVKPGHVVTGSESE